MTTDVEKRFTVAMRRADAAFEKVGGTTRHYVRDCLPPALESEGLAIVDRELFDALVAAVRADDRAIQASCVDPDSTPAADADALALLMRAIALLDERGEG